MQKDLPNIQSAADFSLPLSTGHVRVRALSPELIAELQALANDPRTEDARLVREALRRASPEAPSEAERIAAGATDEDLERVAAKIVESHPWLLGGGPGGSSMVRRFDHETHGAHFRRALMWHRANQERNAALAPAPVVEEPVGGADAHDEETTPGTMTLTHWALAACAALSTAAAVLAGLSWQEARERSTQLSREQRNAFDALQQQLNANNEELRRLRADLQPKPAAAIPEPPKARVVNEPRKPFKAKAKPRREK